MTLGPWSPRAGHAGSIDCHNQDEPAARATPLVAGGPGGCGRSSRQARVIISIVTK